MEEEEKNEENFGANIVCSSKKRAEIDETAHLRRYIMWENKSNSCWVDASMALIAHNKVMKRASPISPNSKMSNIISTYAEILSIINDENSLNNWLDTMNSAKERLTCIQDSTLQFLKPIVKYKPGNPDSAFCSLYNILKEDSIIKGMFEVTWNSIKTCTNCDKTTKSTKIKTIITLSKVDSFDPESPTAIYYCNCKSEQKIKLEFVRLPPCLIFHFENGAGHEKPPLSFFTHGRYYYLTGIMTHEKGQESNLNHFVTWVRDLFVDKWLDCNDLNPDITYFTSNFPDIRFEDVFFYVYESFDELGKITDHKRINESTEEVEEIVLIDISEETDKCNSTSNTHEALINAKKCEVPTVEPQVDTETDSSKSLNKTAGDEEHISDKKVIETDSAHSSETHLNEIKDSENDKDADESITKISLDQGTGHYFEDEEKGTDGLFQDLRLSKDKFAKDVSDKVIQPDFNAKSKFDAYKLNNQINSCFEQKQNDGIVLPYEEKRFENTPSAEKSLGMEVKEDEQNKSLLPGKEIHKSELKIGKPEDLTKADIAESGTSYVKLSFRRKKNPGPTFLKQNFMKKDEKLASDETTTLSVRKSPRCVKETENLKRNEDEEGNTIPGKKPRRTQKVVKTLKDLQLNANEEGTSHLMFNKDSRLSLKDKCKINTVKKNTKQKNKISDIISGDSKIPKDYNRVFTNQETPTFSATANSRDNDVGRVMKGFENVWSTHAPGCNCESKSLEETISIVVDYSFAYLCKLNQEFKKAKSLKKDDSH